MHPPSTILDGFIFCLVNSTLNVFYGTPANVIYLIKNVYTLTIYYSALHLLNVGKTEEEYSFF